VTLACLLLAGIVAGCESASKPQVDAQPRFTSYKAIPGVTDDEIRAVEALKAHVDSFVYGMTLSTELFRDAKSGETTGFAVLVCKWLTALFGIPFTPALYEWGDLLAGFESGAIDFTGEMTPSEKRRKTYDMTDVIAHRTLKYFTLADSPPLAKIAETRALRFGMFEGPIIYEFIVTARVYDAFEAVYVNDTASAYELLKSGKIDAFLDESVYEAAFDRYGDVVSTDFFPRFYDPVSLATSNPELSPIISVVNKALHNGGADYLAELHKLGQRAYMQHKLYMMFTEEERAYIRDHRVIPVAAEHYNYPISFYNKYEHEWQGIFFDVIDKVAELTGLSFTLINDHRADWPDLLNSLESGEAYMLTELLPTEERKAKGFLWPKIPSMADYYALLSKADTPNITHNEVLSARVALPRGTAYAELFHSWYPNHPNTTEYESANAAFDDLERGKVDMVMSSQRRLLAITNYYEYPGYKANLVFDRSSESYFGFNKDQAVLCSIVSKALTLIDIKGISGMWALRTYDYKGKIAQAQRPWLIGATVLLVCVLTLLIILFQRTRQEGKRLEDLIQTRTRELRQTLTKLEAVIRNYKGVIWSVDDMGVITTFNGRYLQVIGVEPSFLEGKRLDAARSKGRHPDIVEHVEKTFREGAQDWIGEIDGGVFHSSTVPMRDGRGTVIGVVGSTDDVTEMVKLQRELATAVDAANIANRAKSNFLASMSHEIRTPLNAVIGMTAIGKRAAEIERKNYTLDRIEEASTHLLGVINDVLDMSKIEASKLELSPLEYNFEKMLQKVAGIIHFRVAEKLQKLTMNVDENIPRFLVGDDQRLAQVITNLLSNAVKFTPEKGEIRFEASLLGETDGLCELRIEVADNGIGISPEQQARLFSAYGQAESGTSRQFGGTGLGLLISKSIIEMMGGKIWIESELGKGARFIFTIQAPKAEDRRADEEPAEAYAALPPMQKNAFAGKRLLLVEDMEINREIMITLLEDSGLLIDSAENGKDALDMVTAAPDKYDMVFMDVQMPHMDGYEATRRIRALPALQGRKLPIIALTANVFKEDIDACVAAGMDDHLGKPFDLVKVCEKLGIYLGTGT